MQRPEQQSQYVDGIARNAATGILGFAPPPDSELVDAIVEGIWAIAQDAHDRALRSTMVQLSMVPDGAHVVS